MGPLLRSHGISRLADLTGLDVVGIPVWGAVRPRGRTLSTAQGKGIDDDAARASAVMEALEHAVAERPYAGAVAVASGRSLRREGADHLALGRVAGVEQVGGCETLDGMELPWVWAEALGERRRVAVPLERVVLDGVLPPRSGLGRLPQDSNGLASGNTRAEACLHALFELIERDAQVLDEAAGMPPRGLDPRGLGTEVTCLVGRCAESGLVLRLRDITSDLGIPVVEAVLHDPGRGPLPPLAPMTGHGCHVDPAVAVCRAVTEAAQTRLTVISGAREDIRAAHHRPREVPPAAPARPWATAPPALEDTLDALLGAVCERLRGAGDDPLLCVDLGDPCAPFAVVRVLAPGLESHARWGMPRGRRATRLSA